LVAQAFLPVPQVAICAASQNKKTKERERDRANDWRTALRSYGGTGRNACATEVQINCAGETPAVRTANGNF